MIRHLPLLPTLVVLICVAIMIRLGFWQLDRAEQKDAMIARFSAAQSETAPVAWPTTLPAQQALLFRQAALDCPRVTAQSAIAGRSAAGESGWAHVASCALPGGGTAQAVIGWSRDPAPRPFAGGTLTGRIAPSGKVGARLIVTAPQGGLEAAAAPDPRDLPNNHLSYAVQWFLFALTALVIYALAVRKRLAARQAHG